MADGVKVDVSPVFGTQDTGNPVLDSLVNLLMHKAMGKREDVINLHNLLLELAAKEPGGLKRRTDVRTSGRGTDKN